MYMGLIVAALCPFLGVFKTGFFFYRFSRALYIQINQREKVHVSLFCTQTSWNSSQKPRATEASASLMGCKITLLVTGTQLCQTWRKRLHIRTRWFLFFSRVTVTWLLSLVSKCSICSNRSAVSPALQTAATNTWEKATRSYSFIVLPLLKALFFHP